MDKKNTILVVDDEERNVRLLEHLCGSLGFKVIIARNGHEAIEQTRSQLPDLILMDVMMPVMNGFEAMSTLKKEDRTRQIPVIMLTALGDKRDRITGIEKGANDYLTKPFDTEELALRIRNNLQIKEYHDFINNHNQLLEKEISKRMQELNKAYEELDSTYNKVKGSYIETIQKLNMAAEYKDEETGTHIRRISLYTKELSIALGMDQSFIETIYYASPMHDIGKVGIPDGILLKEGKLTEAEWTVMKSHTTIGANILRDSQSPFLRMAEEIAQTHHEKWNGTGYPDGLKGEEIPLSGRITNIADQYDALRSKRPYKLNLHHETVIKIITEGDGRTRPDDFDPQVLEAFKKSGKIFDEIFNTECDE
ncbi:MAG: response regulator [Deltaproteobacteria bacterium]|nr:response regulator [Deltaproteobacteria bacterium]